MTIWIRIAAIACVLFVATAARAERCLPAYVYESFYPAGWGFYRPSEIELPPAVLAAVPSVLELYVPDLERGDRPYDPVVLADLNRERERLCREGERALCAIEFKAYGRATGFVFQRAESVMSAFHVVEPYIQMLADREEQAASVPLLIRRGGESELKPMSARIDFQLGRKLLEQKPTSGWDRLADRFRLEFASAVGFPLQPGAVAELNYGASAYVLGFPGKTHQRRLYDRPDSTGREFFVTRGQRIDPYNALRSAGISDADLCKDMPNIKQWEQRYLFVTADATQGNSGGPILDRAGKVIGILTGAGASMNTQANGGAMVTEFTEPGATVLALGQDASAR